jgi:iron complex transport system permease protein
MPPLNARRLLFSLAILAITLLAALAVCTSIGSSGYTVFDLFARGAPTGVGGVDDVAAAMILRVRLPRVLLAAIAGAALGAAGTAFQAVLRNPLADPYILGISGGAALGAIGVTALGVTTILPAVPVRTTAAFLGAVATVGFIVLLASVRGRIASYPMLLIGVVMNAIYLGLILFIETAIEFTRIQGVILWMVGHVPTEGYRLIAILAVILVAGVAALTTLGRDLNLISAGEEVARTLGVTVERVRVIAILIASLVTASVVSVTGLIGFVGLIVPHAARLIFGPDHRLLVPASALTGAIFLMTADTAARVVMAPTELPVGVLTVLTGGPLFLWLYRKHRGETYFD